MHSYINKRAQNLIIRFLLSSKVIKMEKHMSNYLIYAPKIIQKRDSITAYGKLKYEMPRLHK